MSKQHKWLPVTQQMEEGWTTTRRYRHAGCGGLLTPTPSSHLYVCESCGGQFHPYADAAAWEYEVCLETLEQEARPRVVWARAPDGRFYTTLVYPGFNVPGEHPL